jgi:hypothetical protein
VVTMKLYTSDLWRKQLTEICFRHLIHQHCLVDYGKFTFDKLRNEKIIHFICFQFSQTILLLQSIISHCITLVIYLNVMHVMKFVREI